MMAVFLISKAFNISGEKLAVQGNRNIVPGGELRHGGESTFLLLEWSKNAHKIFY